MIIEVKEEEFGNVMKAVSCIEEKLRTIKDVFENDSMGYRMGYKKHDEDEDRMGYRKHRYDRYEPEYRRY